ncbi:Protein of unknown function [Bacillus cereus]|nr:Protein of unknown function [Bacillus cereus]SCN35459.1 Protein of unknown function [Bacillus wiedmannii]
MRFFKTIGEKTLK